MFGYHLISITIAYVIDKLIGDPPNWPHPVRWMGTLIAFLEKRWNRGRAKKSKGVAMLGSVLLISFIVTLSVVWFAYTIHPLVGMIVEAVIIATTIAEKSLKEASIEVYQPLTTGNLTEARKKLSYIVGRDTDNLDEAEIARGAIETVAENTSDGVTAPLFWALIGGAPLAMVYRAANTCDSMVGYMNERYKEFGWASAKWDDLLNWIPSRLTGLIMLLGNRPESMSYKKAWSILFRDARRHPSPNSGWLEAAVAVILGIQLGGKNYYKGYASDRAKMGEPLSPIKADHILKVNAILAKTALLFILVLWLGGGSIEFFIS